MKESSRCSRRQFVQMAGYSSLGAMTLGLPSLISAMQRENKVAPRFAYVGFGGEGANGDGIAVFDTRGAQWKQTSAVSSRMPSSLVLDAREQFLYVVNEIAEYEGLPAGTVEAYAIDHADGTLTLLNRRRLSLSATSPRHAAVSPDGRALVVAVHGGGAYNVLPIRTDGSLGGVTGILKETGSGPHEKQKSAHPQMIVFDRAGRIVSSDLGSDRLSLLRLDGMNLSVAARHGVQAGEGPRHIALHPDGQLLFVANELEASVVCYGYDSVAGRITERLAQVKTKQGGHAGELAMAMDPAGEFLYTAHEFSGNGISAWKIMQSSGRLQRSRVERDEGLRLHQLVVTKDGGSLLGLSRTEGGIFRWRLANGQLGRSEHLVSLPAPVSVAVKSL